MSYFDALAPFLKDFIYREKWDTLREIQVAACDVIFNKNSNLLLASGTASGKTEAAFLPSITKIYEDVPESVGILYISPLKALINDQFVRLQDMLCESNIKVTKWHGDVSASAKQKLLRNPSGILQITPESLEGMLLKRRTDVLRLFSDLRYIIIDEVHNFMSEKRGVHLLSLLERISAMCKINPIRIGLSATLGDYGDAEKWLNSGTGRKCITPGADTAKKNVRISLEHFYVKYDSEKPQDAAMLQKYYDYLFACTFNKKSIIFSNSKAEVEENIAHLKKMAKTNRTEDVYLVHHGNISSAIREFTESTMKTSDKKNVAGATVTLELGIDLGELERIVQTGSPFTVSSFVQRLGRSGRRGNPSEMWFVFREEKLERSNEFYKAVNWNMLRCIAIILCYVEDKWIEPIHAPRLPYDILYHQTMSFMYSSGEITPRYLAQNMLSLDVFKHISQEDYKTLLRYMLEKEQIEFTERGGLLIGKSGEYVVNNYEFYSVFENETEYSVKCKSEEIGSVQQMFPVGESFALAGRTWRVIEADKKGGVIYVEEIEGISTNKWFGFDGVSVHNFVMKKVRSILNNNVKYPFLSGSAACRLDEIRDIAQNTEFSIRTVVSINEDINAVFPFLGTAELYTLSFVLKSMGMDNEVLIQSNFPVCIFIRGYSKDKIYDALKKIKNLPVSKESLVLPEGIEIRGKFNDYIPKELLRKQYAEDFLDIESMKSGLEIV